MVAMCNAVEMHDSNMNHSRTHTYILICEVSGCYSSKYEGDCFQGNHPDDGGSKHLWNISHIYKTTRHNIPEDIIELHF
jgi:hypothetical protein